MSVEVSLTAGGATSTILKEEEQVVLLLYLLPLALQALPKEVVANWSLP